MPRSPDLAHERARRQKRGCQVGADALLPTLERELPERDVLGRIDAGDRCADVDAPERRARLVEEAVGVVLDPQVRLRDRHRTDCVRDLLGSFLAAVVVDDDACAFCGESARTGGADPARRPGHDDPFAL